MRTTTAAALLALAASLALAPAATHAEVREYELDASHATLLFYVSHLGFSDTVGRFSRFEAELHLDPEDPLAAGNRVELVIDAASVDTGWAARDEHVRGDDFLDVGNHPEIRFVSTGIEPLAEDAAGQSRVLLTGDLTLRGATRPVDLEVTLNRQGEMRGREVLGFTATGAIDRREFGMEYLAPAIGAEIRVWTSLEIRAAP